MSRLIVPVILKALGFSMFSLTTLKLRHFCGLMGIPSDGNRNLRKSCVLYSRPYMQFLLLLVDFKAVIDLKKQTNRYAQSTFPQKSITLQFDFPAPVNKMTPKYYICIIVMVFLINTNDELLLTVFCMKVTETFLSFLFSASYFWDINQ